jgi:hypothetical protein
MEGGRRRRKGSIYIKHAKELSDDVERRGFDDFASRCRFNKFRLAIEEWVNAHDVASPFQNTVCESNIEAGGRF